MIAGVEKIIRKTFLPLLFFGKSKTLSPIVGALSTISVQKSGPGLLNPVTSSQEKCLSSQWGGRVTDSGRDKGMGVLQFQPPMEARERKT